MLSIPGDTQNLPVSLQLASLPTYLYLHLASSSLAAALNSRLTWSHVAASGHMRPLST